MKILFFDIEVTTQKKIARIGAIDQDGNTVYEGADVKDFYEKAKNYEVLAGHNIIHHDLKFLAPYVPAEFIQKPVIDTLWISSLIFIRKPYHKLIKYYKDLSEEKKDNFEKFFITHQPGVIENKKENTYIENNPIEDSKLSLQIFKNCVEEFFNIDDDSQQILFDVLNDTKEFGGFFSYLVKERNFQNTNKNVLQLIKNKLGKVLKSDFFDTELENLLKQNKLEFIFIFRLLERNLRRDRTLDSDSSILPFWIQYTLENLPSIFLKIAKYKEYKAETELKNYFNYDKFRTYKTKDGGELNQQDIVESGFNEENFLAILATGGGKSLCFQLPAISRSDFTGFLTLVISPLQSLMDDQVKNLKNKNITQQVGALHSGLDPLTRKEIVEKVREGGINLLYLSPEMLRSPSTQNLLEKRIIDRIVIDEAHCFSKWGHDFRIDYMFIADFLKQLGERNHSIKNTKISCFTATAKEEVIEEIKAYFEQEPFYADLKLFRSIAKRKNLEYKAIKLQEQGKKSLDDVKFEKLIKILETEVKDQSCIIFTRYTGAGDSEKVGAKGLAEKINNELGENKAAYFHGKMKGTEKKAKMNAFMDGTINIMVATNAFGMGVDKPDVRYVIHYNVPNSLENYLQEAGRAGRDWGKSTCIILYTEKDLDENLQLNKSSEVKSEELKKLLKYLKKQFKEREIIQSSAKNLIRYSGWVSGNFDEEWKKNKETLSTKIATAISFLEKPFKDTQEPYFVKRGLNRTRIYATTTGQEVNEILWKIKKDAKLDDEEYQKLREIYQKISIGNVMTIEDLPDEIGWHFKITFSDDGKTSKRGVLELVNLLREYHILESDEQEITLSFNKNDNSLERNKEVGEFLENMFEIFATQEITIDSEIPVDKKAINAYLVRKDPTKTSFMDKIDSFFQILKSQYWIHAKLNTILIMKAPSEIRKILRFWKDLGEELIKDVFKDDTSNQKKTKKDLKENITILERNIRRLAQEINENINFSSIDFENFLKFLAEFGIIDIQGGLFLYHTNFTIKKGQYIEENLTQTHYDALKTFYENKTQQAHIMEYFVQMLLEKDKFSLTKIFGKSGENDINQFIEDYFNLDYNKGFLPKYFKGKINEISRNISPEKYAKIRDVSDEQKKVLNSSKNLLINAGPGSGKTRCLVHKVAKLVLEDGISKDEFLLLTFMRSAKFELKNRIVKLIGPQGYFLKIHTFHGFAFELLEIDPSTFKSGDKNEESNAIIKKATEYLNSQKDLQLPYRVIMIDEFQDIGQDYIDFIKAIAKKSEFSDTKIRIIATGDDDQSIMGFAGGNVKFIQDFAKSKDAEEIDLTKNFRSTQKLIDYTSAFIKTVPQRLKANINFTTGRNITLFEDDSVIETWNCNGNYLSGIEEALKNITSLDPSNKKTTAIICHENEMILQINHILKGKGIKAQLLLKNDLYKMKNILEVRRFLDLCHDEQKNEISKDNIDEKYAKIVDTFGENKNTRNLKLAIETLKSTNSKLNFKIVKDFFEDLRDESELIDESSQIFISTFHKAKGREFDNVIICFDPKKDWDKDFDNISKRSDNKRLIYVGMTRAKNKLIILGNKNSNPYFKFLYEQSPKKDEKQYSETDLQEFTIITELKDIYLSFRDDKRDLNNQIGDICTLEGKTFYNQQKETLQIGSKYFFDTTLGKWITKGYKVKDCKIRQKIMYYTENDQNENKEHLVYLFEITLSKEI